MVRAASSLVRRIWLGVGSILLALLVVEMLLAWLAPQIYQLPNVWEYDSSLGWRHRAGASGRLRTPEFDVAYRTDAAGRRISATSASGTLAGAPDGRVPGLRISLYGDSFAEGWGVEAEQSLSGQLKTQLQARQISATVHNYGTAGYGTDQQLLLYSSAGRSQESDVVLVLFYGNDLWNNASRHAIGVERGDKPYFRLGSDGRLRLEGVPVRRHPRWDHPQAMSPTGVSHLAALITTAVRVTEIRSAQQAEYYIGLYGALPAARSAARSSSPSSEAPSRSGSPDATDARWELTRRLLTRFSDTVRAEGEHFVVVYAPSVLQVEPDAWANRRAQYGLADEYDLMRPNQTLAAWAAEAGVTFLDLTPDFQRHHEQGAALFFQDSHWRPAGHHLAAMSTVALLDSLNLVRR